jgi:NAD+ synthetase
MMRQIAKGSGAPLVDCNLVGGNDGLVFDGASTAFDGRGRVLARGASFEEDFYCLEVPGGRGPIARPVDDVSKVQRALALALSDYAGKCGFSTAVLGLSGGIDSAVTAALAVEALGAGRVVGVAMPGPYSSQGSLVDARELARRLGIELLEIPITPVFTAYQATLAKAFGPGDCARAEENLQARIRGAILMALSNRFGHLVLSTGNKSEFAVGYCTLYGDMAGGYALLSDIPKTLVYALAREINRDRERIPEASLSKEPSAELSPNQKDSDSLPLYASLDPLIEALVDLSLPAHIAARRAGTSPELAREIARRIDANEYKRRQAPPGPKVTARAFGEGRRYPIAQKFRA